MPCFHPLSAFYQKSPHRGGKGILSFKDDSRGNLIKVSCGRCIGCRLERSRQWAIRSVHESSLYLDNCFVTLTYSPYFLPKFGSLVVRDLQLFMKRLRRRFLSSVYCCELHNIFSRIRFMACGEYGDKNGRPHYHLILYGFRFPDGVLNRTTDDGHHVFTSDILDTLWGKGMAEFGSATFESAAYVARYVTKKVLGGNAHAEYLKDVKYGYFDGEEFKRKTPEFLVMSRRPGIGKPWLDKFSADIFPRDYVVIRGKKMALPKYYNSILDLEDPEVMAAVKESRLNGDWYERSDVRLEVKEHIQLARQSLFSSRSLPDES